MQMEAEYSDLLERKLMGLYGGKKEKAKRMDFDGVRSKSIIQQNTTSKQKKNQIDLALQLDPIENSRDQSNSI